MRNSCFTNQCGYIMEHSTRFTEVEYIAQPKSWSRYISTPLVTRHLHL